MADINLGQVVGIWLEPSEPPHKNVLWIKTINLLTSEKAGYIWNGIEWINIQGLGFTWKGEFDIDTDYKKNDVVKFEDLIYIKLNDIVNNDDNPDENDDFDLFLPSSSPVGVEGSVQVKDASGKFFGSTLLTWLSGLFSVLGSVFIKGNSSTAGNALEVRNSTNTSLLEVRNAGLIKGSKFGFSDSDYIFFNGVAFVVYIGGVFRLNLYSTRADFTVPISVPSLTVGVINSTSEFIARGSQGVSGTTGFDVRCYAGRSIDVTKLSGVFKAGYTQQNGTDVNIITIQEKTANSTNGKAIVRIKLETYADNAAAIVGGLVAGDWYQTPAGDPKVVV